MSNISKAFCLFFMTILAAACGDESTSDIPDGSPSGCLITSITYSEVYESGSYDYELMFDYDGGRLDHINISDCYGNDCYTFDYVLKYEDNTVIFVRDDEEAARFTFSEGKPTMFHSSSIEDGEELIDELRFTYSGNKLLKVENWDNYSGDAPGEFVLYSRNEMTYTGDNITGVKEYYEDFASASTRKKFSRRSIGQFFPRARRSQLNLESEIAYAYDTQINPLKGTVAGFIVGPIEFFNANNVVNTFTTYIYQDDRTETHEYATQYVYNDKNIPISAVGQTVTSDFTDLTDISFEYDCD